jgi:hypothetical protein
MKKNPKKNSIKVPVTRMRAFTWHLFLAIVGKNGQNSNYSFLVCLTEAMVHTVGVIQANPYAPPSSPIVAASNVKPSDELIEIHIVTHTHDDVGWIATVDEYYVKQVQFILDSAIEALAENPSRKFTYVEIAFFKRWFEKQTPKKQTQVDGLIASGQLSFNLGGWCMSDEATTDYVSEINQMTEGHQYLEEKFGAKARPTVGWHIDPFGHSAATGSLFSDVGFDAFGLNRIVRTPARLGS